MKGLQPFQTDLFSSHFILQLCKCIKDVAFEKYIIRCVKIAAEQRRLQPALVSLLVLPGLRWSKTSNVPSKPSKWTSITNLAMLGDLIYI